MQKTVLVTGTSSGIGAACVERLATAGWRVYAGVRSEADGARLLDRVDGAVVPVILDVTRADHVAAVLARIRDESGMLHGLVNNAGIGVGGPVELLTDDEWRWQMEVNFFSVVHLTREAMPLVDAAGGRFVHIGSIGGRVAQAGLGPYAASKHAVSAFNWTLRAELHRTTKMRSSVVEPGEIKTGIWTKADATIADVEARLVGSLRERYGFMVDSDKGFVHEGRTRGVDADCVARAVEHALTARRPKARYLVGPDAQFVGVLTRMPDRVRELVLDLNSRRLERSGRKLS
jgi:NAD(P)-dependent dehydrogenase (short-subunit alcohol dehydrogenase family)